MKLKGNSILAMSIFSVWLTLTGCQSPQIVKHPDAPMLVTGTGRNLLRGEWIRVSVWSESEKNLIDYGNIPVGSELVGWTLVKYDWDKLKESD